MSTFLVLAYFIVGICVLIWINHKEDGKLLSEGGLFAAFLVVSTWGLWIIPYVFHLYLKNRLL